MNRSLSSIESRRPASHIFASLFLTAFSAFTLPMHCAAGEDQPNVVLFLVDDMGWVDWQKNAVHNPHGSDLYETPNMERLALSGVTFSNAYAASPVCSPTRSAIMTGKNPARTRITDWISGGNHDTTNLTQPNWVKNLPASEVTLAEALQAGGYQTAFFGKWHLGQNGNQAADPLNHGFELNIGGNHKGSPPGGYFAGADGGWSAPGLQSGYQSDDYLSDVLSDHAADYIQQNAADAEPLFVMMSHYLVHNPKQAPQSLINKYNNKIAQLQNQGFDLQGHINATYAGMVEKMDDSLGKLLDQLEDPNGDGDQSDSIRDETLIIFAADNGGLFAAEGGATNNRPLRDGKGSMYEGGIREPFIVSWTGNNDLPNNSGTQGRVSEARTSSHDIYATVLDAAGLLADGQTPQTPSSELDGVSILPALTGESFERGFQYWHYPHFSNQDFGSNLVDAGAYVSAVRKDEWKLIYFYDDQRYELYNLNTDIGETNDVLAAEPEKAAELALALRQYLADVDAQMPIDKATAQSVSLPIPLLDIAPGDFNDDGQVGVLDWQILRTNLFADVTGLVAESAFAMGDNNLDGIINRFDFAEFRSLYEQANGVGSFASLVSRVPEPSCLVLLVSAALPTACTLRRRPAVTSVEERSTVVDLE